MGEEIQLGPGMNAISFTKSRSPLTSADLRLSESLAKSLQVMNVEASQHSPSVTVSIFDALAEILTSTPKPRISSTTEVLQFQNTNNDVKQTLDGVSNNINVNSVKDLTSQDTFMSTDVITTIAKTVQTTEQSTPNVFNRMSVEGTITPSQNIEAGSTSSVNTPQTFPPPTSPPTTPLSARRPFAIKVLYADTERTTDKTTSVTTTIQPTTETSTMVYNTVSDLILSNNKIVSSELTSMLSNNIKNIIKNMDEDSRARLSVDMVKLLNTLIPKLNRSLSKQDDLESLPNTTPYSLEDIKDTANIDINSEDEFNPLAENILQNVDDTNIVNSIKRNIDASIPTTVTTPTVNSTFALETSDSTITPAPGPQATSSIEINTEMQISPTESNSINLSTSISTSSTAATPNIEFNLRSPGADMIIINSDSRTQLNMNTATNNPVPVPFLSNFELNDLSNTDKISLAEISPVVPTKSLQVKEIENIDNIQDPSQLSRLQLWILSKKARVLKMIEDIIRNHNDEISNAPLTELVNDTNQNNVSLSSRLSEIVSTMDMTTTTIIPDINNENRLTTTPMTSTEMTTPPAVPSTSSQTTVDLITTEKAFTSTQTVSEVILTTTSMPLNTVSTIEISTETPASQSIIDTTDDVTDVTDAPTSTAMVETIAVETRLGTSSLDIVETTDSNAAIIQSTTLGSIMATTSNTESVTEMGTAENIVETTTTTGTDTTLAPTSETLSNNVNKFNDQINVITPSTIPKKDYVIFGILPNNTVVRKDPNDDVLETLTESSPYIIYGVLPNNTVIRKFPNGTRVPRIMQKIDILPISPWSLRNPYSPIHNIPAIVRPQSNPIRVSTNTVISTDTSNNGTENQLTTDTVNNLQITVLILCCLA